MIVDANALFGTWSIRTPGIADPDQFVREMDAHDIDMSIIVALSAMVFDTVTGNEDTIEACAKHPDRLKGLCVANPKTDLTDPLEQMRRCRDAGLVGLRLSTHHGYSYSDTALLAPIIDRAAEYAWPVWVSLCVVQSTPHGRQPVTSVAPLLDAWPEVPFIITGVSYTDRLEAMRTLGPRPNARMDLATMQSAFCVDQLCHDLGAGRIVLGTGFAVNCHSITLEKVMRAEISEADRSAILSGTIERLVELG
ncbi:MAG: amidohydrolase family protein [Armatimonadota bacterium]|jgi:predicted TIM-barrel fold metal-dependent hydrolase